MPTVHGDYKYSGVASTHLLMINERIGLFDASIVFINLISYSGFPSAGKELSGSVLLQRNGSCISSVTGTSGACNKEAVNLYFNQNYAS